MDSRNGKAYLSKEKLDVKCSSCGKTIATVSEMEHRYRGVYCVHRTLGISPAFFADADGVLRMSSRAAERMRRGHAPAVRRQRKVIRNKKALYPIETSRGEDTKAGDKFPLPARLQ